MARKSPFIIVASVLAVLLLGVGGVYAFDKSREDLIGKGVSISGIDVSGQRADEARRTLERELTARASKPMVVRAAGKRFSLSPRTARLGYDVQGMVDAAVQRSREGSILARTSHAIRGAQVNADMPPRLSYSRAVVNRFVKRVSRKVNVEPKDAELSFSGSGIDRVPSRDGRRLDAAGLRRGLIAGLEQQRFDEVLQPKVMRVRPETTTAELSRKYPTVLTIDRGGFQLHLFKNLRPVKTYPIAVGQVGYDTPAGLYNIENKTVDPAWNVPNESWAGSLAGTVVPGGAPENPLKSRWLGIFNGAGIHGTADSGSIGSNASHGCIRMHIPDVEELYDQVPVATPVYIA